MSYYNLFGPGPIDIQSIYDFVVYAQGFYTYPARTEFAMLHAGCLLLEEKGRLKRAEESDGRILWFALDLDGMELRSETAQNRDLSPRRTLPEPRVGYIKMLDNDRDSK